MNNRQVAHVVCLAMDADLAKMVGAPSHASKTHDGGILFADFTPHSNAHKRMTRAGFVKSTSKGQTVSAKLGRSSAHSSSKARTSNYTHPEDHTAEAKTTESKYGGHGPSTQFHIRHA